MDDALLSPPARYIEVMCLRLQSNRPRRGNKRRFILASWAAEIVSPAVCWHCQRPWTEALLHPQAAATAPTQTPAQPVRPVGVIGSRMSLRWLCLAVAQTFKHKLQC